MEAVTMSAIQESQEHPSRELLLRELRIARSALRESRADLAALRQGVERLPVQTISAGVRAGTPAGTFVSLEDLRALLERESARDAKPALPRTPDAHRTLRAVPDQTRDAEARRRCEFRDGDALCWSGNDG